ncbi:MAG: hypothetical protein CL878_06250 [Dehalococcoidia bacterium]|nr:hypothetical protein [Dehalococcoidia bacterium]
MASETTDFAAVLAFIRQAERRDCMLPDPALPEPLRAQPGSGSLDAGLADAYAEYRQTSQWRQSYRVLAAGWMDLEGVLVLTPAANAESDLHASIAATNERALRELLLAFPRGQVGRFYYTAPWMLPSLAEVLDGVALPAREGYFATANTFRSVQPQPVSRLGAGDYDLVRSLWSEAEFRQHLSNVYACVSDGQLAALCFHRRLTDWRHVVQGVLAEEDCGEGYAESVYSVATQEVLDLGRVATCTASLGGNSARSEVLTRVGYRPFYRFQAYRGIKRGSGSIEPNDPDTLPAGRQHTANAGAAGWSEPVHAALRPRRKRRDPAVGTFRDLLTIKGRTDRQLLSIEEPLLVRRALSDGLPTTGILYTEELTDQPDGPAILEQAKSEHIAHHRVSRGVMGTVTATRPLPWVVAAVHLDVRDAAQLHCATPRSCTARLTVLLIADRVANPANLGMILRTADAAGVEAVVLLGADSASPFHKHCVRAARGAIGRLPLYACNGPAEFLQRLKTTGFALVGATVQAQTDVHSLALRPPVALVVGNESEGIRPAVLAECTDRVRIPMAPGQSSLNVGVAAGVLLYEVVRARPGHARSDHA